VLVRARDPHDEAEHLAAWIAERCARGEAPDDLAIVVSPDDGSADRMRRALTRHGVATQGAGVLAARASTAWQVMRAAVRLAWRGVDVVDLTTVLSAPGSGLWGGDRDQLCASLRRSTPGDWIAVRACLDTFAAPEDPVVDAARLAQRADAAQRVAELVAIWEACGPFARLTPFERLVALTRIVDVTIARFMGSVRLADAIRDPRTQALWIEASSQVADAARTVLTRWQRRGVSPSPYTPGSWLAEVEGLLGTLDDAALPMRGEGVHLVLDAAACVQRPRVLVITGFSRGRFPPTPPRMLLLGPVERALLSTLSPDLAAIPDESSHCDDAERFVLRSMATPTEQLVLVAPRRSITGDDLDVALAWRDALAALTPEAHTQRARTSPPSLDRWVESQLGATRSTPLARRDVALTAMRRAQTSAAVSAMAPLAAASQATRDLLVSVARPERDFSVAALVRSALAEAVLTPRTIETMLTCRYAFLMTVLLGLRTLPLSRAPTLTRADRARVAMAAVDHLSRTDGDEDTRVERALDRAIATALPWATAEGPGQVAFVELRRSVGRFLRRYADVGQSMGVRSVSAPTAEVPAPFTIAMPGERPKAMRVDPSSFRAVALRAQDGRGEVILDLRHGSTRAMRALREAGLDVETALAPLVLAAAGSSSVLRLSLLRAEGEVIGAQQTGTPSLVILDHDPTLSEHQRRVLTSIAQVFDALEADDARYEPMTASRAAELDRMFASPCTRCSMRLGCRLGLPGDAERVP
jgi:hypothetical protein